MLKRNLLAALVLAAASSATFAANTDSSNSQVVEGKAACTAQVEGTARQTAELAACDQFKYPNNGI